MSILIDRIRIKNFRGIQQLEINLSRVTVLLGTNNAGKTSVLKALQLALGDYGRYLTEEDFYINRAGTVAEEITIDVHIVADNTEGEFSEEWLIVFGDHISLHDQSFNLRVKARVSATKNGFDITRHSLESWTSTNEKKFTKPLDNIPFIAVEAQRDIHQELKNKHSIIGKTLAQVQYNQAEITQLETKIKDINDHALANSNELQHLKHHLSQLNHSFQGAGSAEITPFPSKIRDLAKYFSIYFGDDQATLFSMEYHGMGTRSWASMLAVKSFTELMVNQYKAEESPCFPVLAAEEPEAHLHPNAQRTLYRQLETTQGQVIVSTHSPYLAAMAKQSELRFLKKSSNKVKVYQLSDQLEQEEKRKLQREIIHSRGEILFSNALILCEGETEEQALPILFQHYFDREAFELGVNIISVGGSGARYRPFLQFGQDIQMPIFIFSDGEQRPLAELQHVYGLFHSESDVLNDPFITVLEESDWEDYLQQSGHNDCLEKAIEAISGHSKIEKHIDDLHGKSKKGGIRDYRSKGGRQRAVLDILREGKTRYATATAEQLCTHSPEELPPKIKDFFEKVRMELSL
jgi:putative ATP-dependent endonuclease of OLD family